METRKKLILENDIWKETQSGDNLIFSVKTYLSVEDMFTLLSRYVYELFSNNEDGQNVVRAENGLIIGLIELCTNIELVDESGNANFSMDDVMANYNIVETIKENINNWSYFNHVILYKSIQEELRKKEYENSISYRLNDIYNKTIEFLQADFSPEKIDSLKDLLKEIEKSPLAKMVGEKVL